MLWLAFSLFSQYVVWVSLPTSRNFHAKKLVTKVILYSVELAIDINQQDN